MKSKHIVHIEKAVYPSGKRAFPIGWSVYVDDCFWGLYDDKKSAVKLLRFLEKKLSVNYLGFGQYLSVSWISELKEKIRIRNMVYRTRSEWTPEFKEEIESLERTFKTEPVAEYIEASC